MIEKCFLHLLCCVCVLCVCVDACHCVRVQRHQSISCATVVVCHCSPVSGLVPQVHRCLMALLMPVRGRFSVNTHTVVGGGGKRGMKAWRRGADLRLMKEKLADKR